LDFELPIRSIAAVRTGSGAQLNKTFSPTFSEASTQHGEAAHAPATGKEEALDPKAVKKAEKERLKAEKKEKSRKRTEERNARTGIGALTGEMRDRGEGGGRWGWLNFIGRGCF
jgi:hypothetical protein